MNELTEEASRRLETSSSDLVWLRALTGAEGLPKEVVSAEGSFS